MKGQLWGRVKPSTSLNWVEEDLRHARSSLSEISRCRAFDDFGLYEEYCELRKGLEDTISRIHSLKRALLDKSQTL